LAICKQNKYASVTNNIMQIDICTNYRFQGNLSEIITVYNKAIRPLITTGPDASDLNHIMSNQIQYCSGNSEFFYSINHGEDNVFELCITINKPSAIIPVLEKIFSDNFNRTSGNEYYRALESENEQQYASV
jgi:hypothetical protein